MIVPDIISVNQDIVQINNYKDIKLLSWDFVNIALEAYWYIYPTERHYMVLKVAVLHPKSRFPFIFFTYLIW